MGKRVKIQITRSGIYGADGQLAVGSSFPVDEDQIPANWAGKYTVLNKNVSDDDAEVTVNPTSPNVASSARQALDAQAAEDRKEAEAKQAEADKQAREAEAAKADAVAKTNAEDAAAATKKQADKDAAAAAQKEDAKKLPGQK